MVRAIANPAGPAGEVLARMLPPHVLVLSVQMLAELAEVITRDSVRRLHGLTDGALEELLEALETGSLLVATPRDTVAAVVEDDPDDDFVIAAAISGSADVICTLDRHLQSAEVRKYRADRAVEVLTDIELLDRLRRIH